VGLVAQPPSKGATARAWPTLCKSLCGMMDLSAVWNARALVPRLDGAMYVSRVARALPTLPQGHCFIRLLSRCLERLDHGVLDSAKISEGGRDAEE
jgi:hypothetical protein